MAYFIDGQITPYAPTQNDPNLTPYVRPIDWLAMPEVEATEEVFVGLFAIFDVIGNFVALEFEGDYTVNWGDGTIEDFASGVKAQHSYDYSTIDNSTLCSRGYKQALITVTPQVGQNLTSAKFGVTHDNIPVVPVTFPSVYSYIPASTPWLDITLSLPSSTTISSANSVNTVVGFGMLEVFTLVTSGNTSDLEELLAGCDSLQQVSLLSLPLVETMNYFLSSCESLQKIILPELPALYSTYYMFAYCYNLKSIVFPSELPSLTDAGDMFSSCVALRFVTFPSTPLLEDTSDLFVYCYSLEKVTFSSLTSLSYANGMFYECPCLKSVSFPPTPALSDAEYMFEGCYALKTVIFSDLSSLEYVNDMFYNCYCLESVVLPSTFLVTEFSDFSISSPNLKSVVLTDLSSATYLDFTDCSSLQRIDLPPAPLLEEAYFYNCPSLLEINIDSPSLVYLDYIAQECYSLRSFSVSDASSVSSAPSSFEYCYSLAFVSLPGLVVSVSVADCAMSRDAIVSLFNDLGTASETIDVSGNYGVADLTGPDLAIATGKGWTVVV